MKNWLIALGVVIGIGAIMFFSDRPVKTREGAEVIRNGDQYQAIYKHGGDLAIPIINKADSGQEITKEEEEILRKAALDFEAMRNYQPSQVVAWYLAGKCYMLVGEKQKAAERLEQAALNLPLDSRRNTDEVKLTAFEAEGLLSEVLLDLAAEKLSLANTLEQTNDPKNAEEARKNAKYLQQRAYDAANVAAKNVPKGVRYLVARGNAAIALGRKEEGKTDILAARKLAPNDSRVKIAASLIGL